MKRAVTVILLFVCGGAFAQQVATVTDLRLRRAAGASGAFSFRHNGNGILRGYNTSSVETSSWDASTGTFTGVGTGLTIDPDNLTDPVPVNKGGSGLPSVASNALLYGNGTSPLGVLTLGASGTYLRSNGSVLSYSGLDVSEVTGGLLGAQFGGLDRNVSSDGTFRLLFTNDDASGYETVTPNVTTARMFLLQTGDGADPEAPEFDTLDAADIPAHNHSATHITSDFLAAARGGLGANLTTNGSFEVLYTDGAGGYSSANGNSSIARQFLLSQGDGADPAAPIFDGVKSSDLNSGAAGAASADAPDVSLTGGAGFNAASPTDGASLLLTAGAGGDDSDTAGTSGDGGNVIINAASSGAIPIGGTNGSDGKIIIGNTFGQICIGTATPDGSNLVTVDGTVSITGAGALTADGSNITDISAANITSDFVALARGGLGRDVTQDGSFRLLYTTDDASDYLSVPPNVTSTRKFLMQVGDDVDPDEPVFDVLAAGDLPADAALESGANVFAQPQTMQSVYMLCVKDGGDTIAVGDWVEWDGWDGTAVKPKVQRKSGTEDPQCAGVAVAVSSNNITVCIQGVCDAFVADGVTAGDSLYADYNSPSYHTGAQSVPAGGETSVFGTALESNSSGLRALKKVIVRPMMGFSA